MSLAIYPSLLARCNAFIAAVFLATSCVPAFGAVVTAQLTGDPRPGNPDNLIVDVSITFDPTSNISSWVVDINSPLHPNIKLDGFYFNLGVPFADVTAQNASPANDPGGSKQWVLGSGNNAQGTGSANFVFVEELTGSGSGALNEVNNSVNLTFDLVLSTGDWQASHFTGAPTSTGDAVLGPMQLAVHLQSLTASSGQSDSGVARGFYEPVPSTAASPEPASLVIWGIGAVGMAIGAARRRRQKQTS